jgi:hypothetical protein
MTRDQLVAMKSRPAKVPCGSCRACCKQDRVVLTEAESARFQWHEELGERVLDRKTNGECVYLTDRGCSVHDAPPDICARFDCRVLFLLTNKAKRRQRVKENPTMRSVYDAGKRRLDTLEAA